MRPITTRTLATLLLAAALFGLCAGAASAQEFLGKHGDWNVIGYVENGKRYCYIHSTPTKQSGNYTKRGEPYILVIRRPDGAENVSVTSGYPYKPDAEIEVKIGSTGDRGSSPMAKRAGLRRPTTTRRWSRPCARARP